MGLETESMDSIQESQIYSVNWALPKHYAENKTLTDVPHEIN